MARVLRRRGGAWPLSLGFRCLTTGPSARVQIARATLMQVHGRRAAFVLALKDILSRIADHSLI